MSKKDQIDKITDFYQGVALQHREPSGPAPTGHCLHCDESLDGGQRWCNADCRDDWERLKNNQVSEYP